MWHEYPYTDAHELNLDWFLKEFKTLVETWEQVQSDWNSLHDYVQNYFDNLNVQTEINNKINAMIADGSFALILTPLVQAALPTIVDGKLPAVVASQIGAVVAAQIDAVVAGQLPAVAASAAASLVENWLELHIDPDTGYVIDKSLSTSNAAADAKTTGDAIQSTTRSKFITFNGTHYINTNVTVGDTVDLTPVSNAAISYAIIDCIAGDKFNLNSELNYGNARAWCFIDSDNKMLERSGATITATDLVITAPANTAKCILNSYTSRIGVCFKNGVALVLQPQIDDVKSSISMFSKSDITLTAGTYTYNVYYNDQKHKNMLVKCVSKYSGDGVPTIRFVKKWKNRDNTAMSPYYTSPYYPMCNNIQYIEKNWRIAPWFKDSDTSVDIIITVPDDTTLYIKDIWNEYEDCEVRHSGGIRLNAHGTSGFGGPINVIPTYLMAAKLGYEACITIPKVTSDGVYVCLHNDTDIGTYVYYDDGTEVPTEVRNNPVSSFTYAQLLQFDFGVYRGYPFKGARIPTLEEFFLICAKTGMKPMLSVHPNLDGHWNNIKELAKNTGVLQYLGIKSDHINISYPMSVLGDEIESYTIDTLATTTTDMNDIISEFNEYKSIYNLSKVRCVIEGMNSNVWSDDNITLVKSAGYELSVVNTSDQSLMATMISKGIHEFTEDYNSCNGLNW